MGLGNVLNGKCLGDGMVETKLGVLTVQCEMGAIKGEQVALLIRPERVRLAETENSLKGRVTDVLFQKNGYRVSLDNGLYFYTSTPPENGERLNFIVEAEYLG